MADATFVHLRVHTAHSLAEGAIKMKDLGKRCAELGMPAVAMTDSCTLSGAMDFTKSVSGAGVQPIVGAQLLLRHPGLESGDELSKIVLLAKDGEGYANLIQLVSHGYIATDDGHNPAVDLKQLKELSAGLIALTGGPEGPVDKALAAGAPERARQRLQAFARIFGDRAYCELQRDEPGVPGPVEAELIQLADTLEMPLVATNDAYFLTRDMHAAHDVLLCISEGAYVATETRRRVSPERYLKSPEEMVELFADLPDAVDNTVEIARRCAVAFETAKPILPAYPDLAEGKTEAQELRDQAHAGLHKRFVILETPEERKADYRKRLDFELDVIERMGFPGYFLIVADFIQWAKDRGISVGPGRGSGAGSLVAYAMSITDLDPLRYGLLFERFLNPDRVSMPDFDVDFCQERRDEVIDYVRERYGDERVIQIGTFGKLQARAAVRDVGRVLQLPYPVVDRYSKLIPNNPANPTTLPEALELDEVKEALAQADHDVRRMFEIAVQLEGLYRHASTHAAGVVIADRPVAEIVPVMRDKEGKLATNCDMKAVESAGLVKFDFLGLKTLDVIEGAREMVAEAHAKPDFDRIGVDDAPTYAMLQGAESFGVFQLESDGMRAAMRGIKPSTIDDLVALVSLYRPGPMENIPVYAAVKHGEQDPDYMHPLLADLLRETFGIMVYQEQVMELARILAGYSLGQADLLRRAMGKKIAAEMDAQFAVFTEGAQKGWADVELEDGRTVRLHRATKYPAADGNSYTVDEAAEADVELAI
ncbi:hypothetical protein CKO28_04870 [Rhodovibrio sodomensis]|uniref:DNA polymerase III subunit alpha n=1 Tax=Rhodovibrio sodomensis TaxID=1088 RepID=A0ABS1DBP2_9PROT|nr:DNA polymerase III subunit alpha [Rhodovibrio sodomensis]MBK1667361.1 hypothetical protein [Rhodovibrio sodomensis]